MSSALDLFHVNATDADDHNSLLALAALARRRRLHHHINQERCHARHHPDTVRTENKRNVDRLFEACFNHGDVAAARRAGLAGVRRSPGRTGTRRLQGDRRRPADGVPRHPLHGRRRRRRGRQGRRPLALDGDPRGSVPGLPASHHKVSAPAPESSGFGTARSSPRRWRPNRLGFLQQVGVVPPDAVLNAPQRPRP